MSSSFIYIDGWKANIRFSSAHIIPEYEKCGRLHGHTYAAHLKIFGKPDDKGIIIDFSIAKDTLRKICNGLDHKVLIPEKNNKVQIEKDNDSLTIFTLGKKYILPISDCCVLPISSTSAEKLSSFLLSKFLEKIILSDRIESIEIGVDEGFGQGARITKKIN